MTFRRGPVRRAALWTVVAAGWLSVGGVGLWGLGLILGPGWSAGKVVNLVAVAGIGAQLAYTVSLLRGWNRNFAVNWLTIDDDGVRGQLTEQKLEFRWAEVKGVARGKVKGTYLLDTSRGPIPFSALDIPRPKRAARAIAARLGTRV